MVYYPYSIERIIEREQEWEYGLYDNNSPDMPATYNLLKIQLLDILKTLTPREETVLRMRFGLDDGIQETLENVGKTFNLSRTRIDQIEAKALRKMRHPSRSKKLKDYLD